MSISSEANPSYLEDFCVGQEIETGWHVITESDVMAFAALSGDQNGLHTDDAWASAGPYGRRIAHGLLVVGLVSGLAWQLGVLDETVLAFRRLDWKFRKPVFIGDTIWASVTVAGKRAVRRIRAGIVDLEIKVHNQTGVTVQTGRWSILVKSRGAV